MKVSYLTWVVNDVLPNDLLWFQASANFDIQSFLNVRGGFLKDYTVDGVPYSDWLKNRCSEANLNPKAILVNLQKEQRALTRLLPPENVLNRILGYGMTDSGDMPKFYGFAKQHECAIQDITRDFAKYKAMARQPEMIIDNGLVKIRPSNAMTSMLYEYTPWSGDASSIWTAKWGGIHGVYLFWRLWSQYWPEDLRDVMHTEPKW